MIFPDLKLEQNLQKKGYKVIFGIDEAGRGPLAGPVVAGCVYVENEKILVEGVRDSKKISKKKRECIYEKIISKHKYGVGVINNMEIDRVGIQEAVKRAMLEAVNGVGITPDYLIVDGKGVLMLEGYKMEKITRGDLLHYSIAAGSIIAKVHRDKIMEKFAAQYPEYGFENHVGYGTKAHMEAINRFGPCDIHRRSFEPIKTMMKK